MFDAHSPLWFQGLGLSARTLSKRRTSTDHHLARGLKNGPGLYDPDVDFGKMKGPIGPAPCIVLRAGLCLGWMAFGLNVSASALAQVAGPQNPPIAASDSTLEPQTALAPLSSLSETWTAWSLAVLAGSVILLVNTSYRRPRTFAERCIFLIFLPAWAFLALSVAKGSVVQRRFAGALMTKNVSKQVGEIHAAAADQLQYLEVSLGFVVLWLLVYFAWWMFHTQEGPTGGV